MKISWGILAGGNCKGGENAAVAKLENRRNVKALAEAGSRAAEVLISAGVADGAKGLWEDLGLKVVYDRCGGRGAIEGIYNLLSKAETQYVFVCGSDMPNITGEVADYLSQFISSDYDCWCMTAGGKPQPLCAIYSKKMLPAIREAMDAGEYSLRNLLKGCRTKFVKIEFSCFGQEVLLNKRIKSHEAPQSPCAIFCVCGYKNAGKTGLIVKLINEFINRGFSVGAIKHDGHDYVMDRMGTDTQRFGAAGAQRTIIFSKDRYSLNGIFKPEIDEQLLPRRAEGMIKLCSGTDIVIIEGLKALPYPKIVMGDIKAEQVICRIIEKKTEFPESPGGDAVLERDDIEGIFLCLKEYFGLPERGRQSGLRDEPRDRI